MDETIYIRGSEDVVRVGYRQGSKSCDGRHGREFGIVTKAASILGVLKP
jgi:mannose/fructose/N-acetylgalactosamine-specific phosphotransferase system component IID